MASLVHEKKDDVEVNVFDRNGSSSSTNTDNANKASDATIKRVVRKVDKHIIGIMGMVIVIEFLDRVGVGFARIAGIDKDLHLEIGFRFSLVVMVGSIASACMQIPMMAYASRVRPPVFIGLACCGWAMMYIGQGLAQHWSHLIGYRIIGGALHGGLNQVSIVLVQTWYVRYDLCRRLSWISVITWLSKALGGAAAYGITRLDGAAGLAGWRWIYLFAGILTFLAGVLSFCFIVGFGDSQKWRPILGPFLSSEEMEVITQHLEDDRREGYREPCTAKDVFRCAWDFKFWLFGLISMSTMSILVSLAVFSPLIVHKEFGFDRGTSQGLYAPPYVFTAIVLIVVSEISDRTQNRSIPIVVCTLIGMIGLILIGFTEPIGLRYFGMFITNGGLAAIVPLTQTYLSNNIRGFHKRAFGVGLGIAFSGIGGIIGSCVFRSQDEPKYIPGLIVSIALCLLICTLVGILNLHFHSENRKQAKGKVLEGDKDWRHTY